MYEAYEAQAVVPVNRSERLIEAAVDAFGSHGYQGASLRDIAREAGSSVTLIAHHFGAKSGLVTAVVHGLHRAGAKHLIALRGAVEHAATPDLATLLEAWTRYAFDVFGHAAGAPWLRMMLRLRTDAAVDAATSRTLDASEPTIRQALRRLRPAADDATIDLAWDLSSGALYNVLSRSAPAQSGAFTAPPRRESVEVALKAMLVDVFDFASSPA
jgi:AcrR family transcriptional regulator